MTHLAQYRDVDDDRWRYMGEYPTKAEAATAANAYYPHLRTRVHRINEAWQSQFPDNCAVVEVTGDGDEVGACTYHLKNGVCPRHGEVKEE